MTAKIKGAEVEIMLKVDKFKADLSALEKNVKTFASTNQRAANDSNAFGDGLRNTARQIAVMEGPLGGVAGRFSALATSVNGAGLALTAFGLASAGVTFLSTAGVKAFSKYEVAMLQLEAQMQATGFAAGFTAKEMDAMAIELGRATLGSAEGARKAIGALLPFTELAGDTFKDILYYAQDIASVYGGELSSKAVMLARALERPAESMVRLERSGLTFTAAQKELAKDLEATGDKAGAQALIMERLQAAYGDAGETATRMGAGIAGAWDTAGEAITRYLENVGSGQMGEIFKNLGAATGDFFDWLNKGYEDDNNIALLTADVAALEQKLARMREQDTAGTNEGQIAGVETQLANKKKMLEKAQALEAKDRAQREQAEQTAIDKAQQRYDEALAAYYKFADGQHNANVTETLRLNKDLEGLEKAAYAKKLEEIKKQGERVVQAAIANGEDEAAARASAQIMMNQAEVEAETLHQAKLAEIRSVKTKAPTVDADAIAERFRAQIAQTQIGIAELQGMEEEAARLSYEKKVAAANADLARLTEAGVMEGEAYAAHKEYLLQLEREYQEQLLEIRWQADAEEFDRQAKRDEKERKDAEKRAKSLSKSQADADKIVLAGKQNFYQNMENFATAHKDKLGALGKAMFLASKGAQIAQMIMSAGVQKANILQAASEQAKLNPLAADAILAKGTAQANIAYALGISNAAMVGAQAIASFEGGGMTPDRPRSGGIDGKGGFLSVLHPNEKITDMTKGGGAGVNVTINNNTAAIASVERMTDEEIIIRIDEARRSSVNESVGRVNTSLMRGRGSTATAMRSGFDVARAF